MWVRKVSMAIIATMVTMMALLPSHSDVPTHYIYSCYLPSPTRISPMIWHYHLPPPPQISPALFPLLFGSHGQPNATILLLKSYIQPPCHPLPPPRVSPVTSMPIFSSSSLSNALLTLPSSPTRHWDKRKKDIFQKTPEPWNIYWDYHCFQF